MAQREKLVAFRISAAGLALIDDLAAKADVKRSEMIRRLLAKAANLERR